MAVKTYLEKLKDPRWQKKRLEVFERDNFTCTVCGNSKSTLHVHHIFYRSSNPWESDIDDLLSMCEGCHKEEEDSLKKELSELNNQLRKRGFMSTQLQIFNSFVSNILYNKLSPQELSYFLWNYSQNIDFNKEYNEFTIRYKKELEDFEKSLN
jgi:formate-dependent nitrite reductase cytochrome c552 subunit